MSQEAALRLRDFLKEFRSEIDEILADRHLHSSRQAPRGRARARSRSMRKASSAAV